MAASQVQMVLQLVLVKYILGERTQAKCTQSKLEHQHLKTEYEPTDKHLTDISRRSGQANEIFLSLIIIISVA